jgi:hypothetical protein
MEVGGCEIGTVGRFEPDTSQIKLTQADFTGSSASRQSVLKCYETLLAVSMKCKI